MRIAITNSMGLLLLFSCVFVTQADELRLTNQSVIKCEIYKETPTEILFIEQGAASCRKLQKKNISKIIYHDKDIVDLSEFLKKNEKTLSAQQKSDIGAEVGRRKSPVSKLVASTKKKPSHSPRKKIKIRTMKQGVTVLKSSELRVDPFPEEEDSDAGAVIKDKTKTSEDQKVNRKAPSNVRGN